ncbi:carbamoyltransferase C-terminal domain-containing protein [Actinoplanes teichomyceticus]|uniref:Carbamoyltransferase n=1 Tax=Actinoplanes teichomyceticus TaxID=1867 RepID=A0A1B1ESN6_ACTTI|nr:carbamoyltransferase C-terminal domain-containing protein [Actinoplanes teichomyceticus]ANQ31714.1 carbomoyltransferase [Actinoplanes teichomyceticus]TWG14687.1 carbamoyltransferase [Actinoplanes teichomyceticus]GIF10090.1 carbamoyltransferase [Actinoplanes teichomyceticus]
MKVLSLHSLGHDAGVSYFEDGVLRFSIEAERLSRVKHDGRVDDALQHVLRAAPVNPDEVDLIAVSTPFSHALLGLPDLDAALAAINSGALHHRTTSTLLGRPVDCVIVTHEVSHAALAAHYAGHSEGCVVLVNEGRGQITRSSLFRIEQGMLRWLEKDPLPWYGNGFGWSALGYLFGFGKSPSVAGKVMALGGYGQPRADVRDLLLGVRPDVMADPAAAEATYDDLSGRPQFARDFQTMADAIATFQTLFTEQVYQLLARHTGVPAGVDVALGGGCALNIVANAELRSRLGRDIAIPPACGDSGHSIGAGVYAMHYVLGQRVEPFDVYVNGRAEAAGDSAAALTSAGLRPVAYDGGAAAQVLAGGGVVAFLEGAAEVGPRALGHRSLLGDPSAEGMRKRLSEELKRREWFRPLGAVIREDRFAELFPGQPVSPYMLFNYDVREGLFAQARHVDGTSRLQTLTRAAHPRLFDLLGEFEQLTGTAALINTSLNGPGRAIAQSSRDMIDDFGGQDVDLFVAGDVMAYRAGVR